jgi:glycerol-3-phosphate acyltransferase PlsX
MNIAVDAMGGDNAPLEVVKGAINAALEYKDLNITLVGDEAKIRDISREIGVVIPNNVEILHSSSEVTMEDDPMIVMKEKKDSSMAMGLKLLKEDGVDAFISAGNTGALHTASTLIVRKMKGVRRSAIAAILPFDPPVLLLDSGANPVVTADLLLQWAIIGSAYMKNVFGVENPRVGLLNNGTEEHKGTPVACEAFSLLKKSKVINFVGNIESKEIPNSPCDVLVTDGFTGNIALKLIEGMGKFIGKSLNDIFRSNVFTKLSYLITFKEEISKFRTKLDASEYGGAPLLGLSKPVIKAHGSSKAKEIKNAIRQAIEYTNSNIIEEVSKVF